MLPLFAHSRHIALPPVFVWFQGRFSAKYSHRALKSPEVSEIGTDYPLSDCRVSVSFRCQSSSPVLPGVVPPLNLTAAYRSLWYARFGQGSSISLPKVMALHRRGSISHTGWSFDWNNPSMNYLYHRTFLCPVPYVHKVGIRGKNQKFPRLRN